MNRLTSEFKHRLLLLMSLTAASLGFFGLLNPRHVPSWVLIVAFVLLGALLYVCADIVVRLAGITSGMSRITAAAAAGVVVVVLLLNTIGQLTLRDLITLAIFLGLLYFYGSRTLRK